MSLLSVIIEKKFQALAISKETCRVIIARAWFTKYTYGPGQNKK